MNKVKIPTKGNRIEMENKVLKVPDNPIIPFIEGDGIGEDIWKYVEDHIFSDGII